MKLNKIMLAMVVMSISGSALAHGYIENPPSRNLLCHADGKNLNKECGAVQYEPQSSGETADGFPEKGPADGKLASGDNWISKDLNQQTAERWAKTKMKAGVQPFTWVFTQSHPIASFKYYMTKQDWNPNAPLTRDSFDLTPFCVLPSAPAIPQTAGKVRTTHECDVPERTGYQVIYGAWDVADTAGTFYQMIDAQFDDATGEVVVSEWTASVGKIEPATDLNAGDKVKVRVFTATGEQEHLSMEMTIDDASQGKKNSWAHALASKINKERDDLRAGYITASGKVAPVHGVNTLYTKAGSPITSIVISIDKAPVEVQSDFSVAGMKSEYQMIAGALTLNVDLAATGKMELEAKVYGPDNTIKGYTHTTLEENASQQVAIEMSDLKAGKYTLVVIGIDAEGKSKQQSIGFTLKGEVEIAKPDIKPEVKPEVKPELDGADKQCTAPAWSNASTYNANDTVTHNGRIYMSKWWADGSSVPGNADVTDTTGNSTGWGKVWEDKGAC
ncbi:N-acetylglucosamine-binding protein GbpA [Yersinia massiliensis]|uniref:N-acetylglucosamine-binding protein GbpA n=1 Tax=Yersinia massiliensis TaxID=419257 RepID=UPI00119E2508|nr:N-acetylglucosamine-binding protein GbpA [Yersinia massiliensis]